MNGLASLFDKGDAVSITVAVVLLGMSVCSWVVIVWKGWFLRRAHADVARSIAAFWQAPTWADALRIVPSFDREMLVAPLLDASQIQNTGTLAGVGDKSQQLTRVLRDALHHVLRRLQAGHTLLATVGASAPFVGLLGTVWSIYHALVSVAGTGQISIDKISGPVGESLIMTAAGLAVAIPAVLGYNMLSAAANRMEADLEGFARDVRELLLTRSEGA